MKNKTKQFVKIIGYILIPIFILISIFSALSLYYRSENQQVQEANNFFETDNFMYMYSASIINNFSINANSLFKEGDSIEKVARILCESEETIRGWVNEKMDIKVE